ncbi:MAG TPA: MarR family winged helix-turn-helix transcriptional regulator [Kofleriaceae bacterium]|jgi:DNA-binding MarR family transcriptional regulator
MWSANYRLLNSVIVDVAPLMAKLGLEIKEFFVLAAIDDHPHPAELAGVLCIPKPSVTAYVKRLEGAGFVHREIDPKDLRRHKLLVTAAGRKVVAKGQALLNDHYGKRLEKLNHADQIALHELLEKAI